ncbi:hypothetical protein PDJAM_G00031690, partial [Pangasius djambal]|nr:hypothetical protein [Pangasius djambal]
MRSLSVRCPVLFTSLCPFHSEEKSGVKKKNHVFHSVRNLQPAQAAASCTSFRSSLYSTSRQKHSTQLNTASVKLSPPCVHSL